MNTAGFSNPLDREQASGAAGSDCDGQKQELDLEQTHLCLKPVKLAAGEAVMRNFKDLTGL